jgi:predicted AAA+ superfamily ATPase
MNNSSRDGFNEALQRIKLCYESKGVSQQPMNLLITGSSCAGKTTLLETFIKMNEGKKILSAKVPLALSPRLFLNELLSDLGEKPTIRRTQDTLIYVMNAIKERNVKVILLDEAHHLITPNWSKNIVIFEMLRALMDHTKVSVVLFGLEQTVDVLKVDWRLARRFTIYNLPPFQQTERIHSN